MNSSLYNSISGVKSFQFEMDVQSNNIANINTVGFKGSSPEVSSLFSTMLTGTYASYSNDDSLGASSQTTALDMSQGILESSDNPFDLAIQGEGWFGVQGLDGKTYYTRAGQFSIDTNGNLVDQNGNYLLATSGNNTSPTTLDAQTLSKFGNYYNNTNQTTMTPYAVQTVGDVPLGTIGNQTKVTLPDLLYYPPIATSQVTYAGNLNPTVTTNSVTVPLSTNDYTTTIIPSSNQVNLSGTTNNTTDLQNPQQGDIVLLTLTDHNGKKITTSSQLDSSLNWSLSNIDISSLDTTTDLTVNASVVTKQEVANHQHFSVGIIGPNGGKDILDMSFTKKVPQAETGTTWNADVKILSYYEDYTIQQYDPTQTYDPTVYNVDTVAKTVTKIYDQTQYYVNTTDNKVYQIVDNQTGVLAFGGAGQLLSNSIPVLSNGGTPLTLNLGTTNSFDGLISSASIDKASSSSADGSTEGFLKDYGMDSNGNVIAEFDNGKSSAIAKVAIYHFQNDQGLTSVTDNLFEESSNSGKAIFYTDKNGNTFLNSKILNHQLEGSNISMATALTELIVIQKAFSASAKGITTSDELLQNAINMKQ